MTDFNTAPSSVLAKRTVYEREHFEDLLVAQSSKAVRELSVDVDAAGCDFPDAVGDDFEDLPAFEGMCPFRSGGAGARCMIREYRRGLTVGYSRLRRCLRSHVGHRWDEVYSKLCRNGKQSPFHRQQLDRNIDRVMETSFELVNGKPRRIGYRFGDRKAVWVNPDTGILMAGDNKRLPALGYLQYQKRFEQVDLGALSKLVKIDGVWFVIEFKPLPDWQIHGLPAQGDGPGSWALSAWDIVLQQDLRCSRSRHDPSIGKLEWGAEIYAVSKRQAGKKLIRRHVPKARVD